MVEITVGENETVRINWGEGLGRSCFIAEPLSTRTLVEERDAFRGQLVSAKRERDSYRDDNARLERELREAKIKMNFTVFMPKAEVTLKAEDIAAMLQDSIGRRLAPQWQPIETAPKDGTQVLLAIFIGESGRQAVCYWSQGENSGWMAHVGPVTVLGLKNPTHWMPIQEPPK